MARPFAVIGFSALLSLAMLFFLPERAVLIVLCAAGMGLALSVLLRKKGSSTAVPAALASVFIASLLLLAQLAVHYYPALQCTGEQMEIYARVASNAELKYGRYYYQLQTLRINGVARRIRMRFSSSYALECEPYDEISYTGTVFLLGGDDPEMTEYHKAKGVYLGSYSQSHAEDRVQVAQGKFHVMKPILLLQRAIARNLHFTYSDDTAGLLRGMLLGDKTGMPWAVQEEFRQAGVSHLFSVSGLHMSLLGWALLRFLRRMKLPQRSSALLCAAFVLVFMALTGFTASCVRAGVMMLILLAGELLSRRADTLNSLGLAALVLLLISPLSAGQVGLQLSFGATLGIVLFQRRFAAPMKQWASRLPRFPRKAANAVTESLCVTAAALVLIIPIQQLRLPGGVSLASLPANLLLVPLSAPLMILGGISALLPEPLRSLPAFFAEILGQWMRKGGHALAQLPLPVLRGDAASLAFPLAICAALAAAVLLRRYMGKPVPLRFTAIAMCTVMLACGWLPNAAADRRTQITQLDTGGGQSYLVRKGRRAALLGCGGEELPAGAAKNALSALGTAQLELLVLPGGDNGAAQLQRDVPVKRVLEGEGTASFALWDGAEGIYYKNGEDAACLLRTEQELVLFVFSGTAPEQWQEVKRFGDA